LIQPEEVVDRIFLAADLGMPQMPGPAVSLGATGPVTLAGTVALLTAESLMCLVLAQLRNPGCPCCLGANVQVLDMSTGLFGVGFPEISLGISAQAEVAQAFELPTWGYAGCTDAKVLDAQAGLEAGVTVLSQGLAGLNLIHDVGYMDNAMVCSPAQLVLGNEAIGWTKRFIRGVRVSPETIARDVIASVGPGGHFLQQKHTLSHFREELWRSQLLTRKSHTDWQKEGARDMAERVQEKLADILETHQVPLLPDRTLQALADIKARGEKEFAALAKT
jgi:trimethylamine--corrinoid protein Co-methyltransferase